MFSSCAQPLHLILEQNNHSLTMRQSMAPNRQSQLPGQVPSAALSAKLLEKKKECEAVIALEKASSKFLQRIEELGDDFDIVADAGKGPWSLQVCFVSNKHCVTVHGQVLEQWPNMFRLLGLFREHQISLLIPAAQIQLLL